MPGMRVPGPQTMTPSIAHGALLGRVVVHRDAELVREARGAVAEALARGAHVLRVALDGLDRLLEAHVGEPLARVLDGEPAALGELLGDALDAERCDAGEEAGAAAGDGKVGDVAEVAEELGRRVVLGERDALGAVA